MMDDQQLLRFSRQIMLPGFDVEGQERLLAARVLIVGLGGLGSPAALYLAGAGIGELWLADHDRVDLSNLQRQIAHREADVGDLKVASAAASVAAINSAVNVVALDARLADEQLAKAVAAVDVVLDCSDNFTTRFALNAACWEAGKPLVAGAAIRGEGQLLVIDPRRADSPCYRCLYDENADSGQLTCAENGVLAPLVGVIGAMQALEAVKLLAGYGEPAMGRLLAFDAARLEWRDLRLRKAADCPVCAVPPRIAR